MQVLFAFLKTLQKPFINGRVLGVAKDTRRYDLPLGASPSNGFVRILIALMSAVGMLALCAFFALSAMTERWSSGLENKISVEIPATDSAGVVIDPAMVRTMTMNAAHLLKTSAGVIEVEAKRDEDVKAMLAPWLGEDLVMDTIPLPGLISVTLDPAAPPDIKALERQLKDVAPRARIDTHEQWLNDLLRFTGALQFTALIIGVVIGAVTFIAVAGAVQSKLAESKDDLELLHLMGASDSYIAKQLRRHTLILSFQGGMIGLAIGGMTLWLISLSAGQMGFNLVPEFTLAMIHKTFLVLLPVPIAMLAMVTAHFTVLRVLGKMP